MNKKRHWAFNVENRPPELVKVQGPPQHAHEGKACPRCKSTSTVVSGGENVCNACGNNWKDQA